MTIAHTPPLLPTITHPSCVAALGLADKQRLAQELRQTIITTVAANGGHLAPSLGVVELTLALLSVFNPEEDKLIWDVGHQSYAWKLLTGRAETFHTLRKQDGISGFPKRSESPFDAFGVGHSSTSVSAGLGMALARDLAGQKHHVLAVIGDGSLTAGLAFEGLNQAGDMGRRLIVVLNDNEMSIANNVGALSLFLSRNMERGWARRFRKEVKDWLKSIPGIGDDMAAYAHRTHRSLKTLFTPGMLFEALRFNYIGPVNGHDQEELERHLRMAASIDDQPVLLHVLTRKGKGYSPAEAHPSRFHGLGRFDSETGETAPKPVDAPPTYTDVFSDTLCRLGQEDERVVSITAAMASGTGTARFKSLFPKRFVDVGICEQHAVTFAAGLAAQGYKPFVALYSTFAQRAYDQIVHDVCIQNLPVTLCLDRAGLVGEDGATHHGTFDFSFLRHIPNLRILAPSNEAELQAALCTAMHTNAPLAIRYPRGNATGMGLPADDQPLLSRPPLPEEGVLRRDGTDILILAVGSMVTPALQAAERMAALTGSGSVTADSTTTPNASALSAPHAPAVSGNNASALSGNDAAVLSAPHEMSSDRTDASQPSDAKPCSVAVFDPRWIKPLPERQLADLFARFDRILCVEENALAGGFGSAVLEYCADRQLLHGQRIRRLGLPDHFVEHGTQQQLRRQTGLDAEGIFTALCELQQDDA